MPRPKNSRTILVEPKAPLFKPAGIPASRLEECVLELDELEAIRLRDLEGLYQDQAAEKMNITRQTFGRIIESAHRKIADALIHGKVLRMGNQHAEEKDVRHFSCHACYHQWSLVYGKAKLDQCPKCGGESISRTDSRRGIGKRCAHKQKCKGGSHENSDINNRS